MNRVGGGGGIAMQSQAQQHYATNGMSNGVHPHHHPHHAHMNMHPTEAMKGQQQQQQQQSQSMQMYGATGRGVANQANVYNNQPTSSNGVAQLGSNSASKRSPPYGMNGNNAMPSAAAGQQFATMAPSGGNVGAMQSSYGNNNAAAVSHYNSANQVSDIHCLLCHAN